MIIRCTTCPTVIKDDDIQQMTLEDRHLYSIYGWCLDCIELDEALCREEEEWDDGYDGWTATDSWD